MKLAVRRGRKIEKIVSAKIKAKSRGCERTSEKELQVPEAVSDSAEGSDGADGRKEGWRRTESLGERLISLSEKFRRAGHLSTYGAVHTPFHSLPLSLVLHAGFSFTHPRARPAELGWLDPGSRVRSFGGVYLTPDIVPKSQKAISTVQSAWYLACELISITKWNSTCLEFHEITF